MNIDTMYIDNKDYGLTEIIEQTQAVVWDTSAVTFKLCEKNGDSTQHGTVHAPRMNLSIDYLNKIIEI